MRSQATAKVAVRSVMRWRSAVSQMFFSAPTMILSRRTLISSSVQKNDAEVLHPFEVAHRHAAGVADHVGHHQHAALGQDVVGRRPGRAVGAFEHQLGLHAARAVGGDLAFQRGRDQDVAVHVPELLAAPSPRRP
jgi:hypothetical protein